MSLLKMQEEELTFSETDREAKQTARPFALEPHGQTHSVDQTRAAERVPVQTRANSDDQPPRGKAPMSDRLRAKLREEGARWRYHPLSALLRLTCALCMGVTAFVLLYLVVDTVIKGVPNFSAELFSPTYNSENVSMLPALINTLLMTGLALLFSVPVGVGGAIYLAEYAKRDGRLVKLIRVTAETLSGIPSIIYGLFGMMFFVTSLHLGLSILAGALTLALMVLPLILRTTEEALLSVPDSFREGSFGLGAGKLRTVMRVVLPSAANGILAGVILAIGRVVGETAALLFTAGTFAKLPENLLSSGRTLAVHMYVLSGEGLHIGEAYATAVVLLLLAAAMNGLSSLVSKRLTKGQES